MSKVFVAIAAAGASGILIGLVARLGMALVSLAAGHPSHFTVRGTATIVLIYSAAMLPGALVAAFTRRRIRWVLPTAGALFLVLPAIGVASEEIGDVAGLSALQTVLLVITGIGVFATIPAVAVLTVRLVDRLQGDPRFGPDAAPASTDLRTRLDA